MKKIIILLVCVLLSAPAYAQQSQERRNAEAKATLFLWLGIGVASAGIVPMMAAPKAGLPLLAAGGGMIGYAFYLNSKAKQVPSTTFSIAPMKKGVAFGVHRSW